MKNRILEILIGLTIIIITFSFLVYVFFTTTSSNKKNLQINTIFYNIGSLTEESIVSINGYRVGSISQIKLMYPDYTVQVVINIESDINIPSDSQFTIQTAGLFDPPVIAIIPGKSSTFIKNNQTIYNTKDWESLEDKISNVLFNVTK